MLNRSLGGMHDTSLTSPDVIKRLHLANAATRLIAFDERDW
jgi:hypothetical protein